MAGQQGPQVLQWPLVNDAESPQVSRPAGMEPAIVGGILCAISALAYTGANMCLRALVASNPVWAIWVKETVAVVAVVPLLAWYAWRGIPFLPSRRALGALVLVGLATQLGGNVMVLWALGVIGMAVSIPLVVGVTLVGSAILGLLVLGERVPRRGVVAIGMLIAAVSVLSVGANQANQAVAAQTTAEVGPMWVVAAVAAICMAGLIFAALNLTIRKSMTSSIPPAVIVLMIPGMGTLTLGPISLAYLGLEGLLATPASQFGLMLLAGILNLVAFGSYTKGLQLTTIVHANAINASQTALAAVAGLLFFAEPASPWLVLGVILTIVGLILNDRPR